MLSYKIATLISLHSKNSCVREDKACKKCINFLNEKVSSYINSTSPIHFVLPAFPAKSANRDKTIGHLPDLGESLAIKRLAQLLLDIRKIYPPGAELTICSDGHVFNDIVGVSDEDVDNYQNALIKLTKNIENINFYNLLDAYGEMDFPHMRKKLESDFAKSLDAIKEQVKTNPGENNLFNGLHKFLFEDLLYLNKELSKNKIRKLAGEKTYKTIQRSHAWSALIENKFPYAIRLSIHPHPCSSGKLSFRLLPGSSRWATPWHNVVVKKNKSYSLMKKSEALKLRAQLVMKKNALPHFEILEGAYV